MLNGVLLVSLSVLGEEESTAISWRGVTSEKW